MLAQKRFPIMSPSTSLPNAPPPTTSPAFAPTFAWMGLPNTYRGAYNRSTSRNHSLKTYSSTLNGDLGQRRPKTTSMKHAENHPPSHLCKEPSTGSSDNSITSGHGEQGSTEDGQRLSTSVDEMGPPPSTFTAITPSFTLTSPNGPVITTISFQVQKTRSGLRTLSRTDQRFQR